MTGAHDEGDLAMPSVLRVGLEIENIGERIPSSKKRLSWRFVFADSEEVHTVTLEHSRVSAKKRVKLDGKRIGASESFTAGPWTFEFAIPTHPNVPFQIVIKDLPSLGFLERARANLNPDILYSFWVYGKKWEELTDRPLKYESTGLSNRWSSASYCRRVQFSVDCNQQKDVRVSWMFTFGQDGEVHQLMLEDCADGSKILVLDRMSLRHDQPTDSALTLDLMDEIKQEAWVAQHSMGESDHELVVRVLHDASSLEAKYALFINGCSWVDMASTDYTLQPGYYPVHSKSTGKVYYRDDANKVTVWEKPIVLRNSSGSGADTQVSPTSTKSENAGVSAPLKPVDLGHLLVEPMVDLMNFSDDAKDEQGDTSGSSGTSSPKDLAELVGTDVPAAPVDLLA
ncbi:hypothetical protein H310_02108 [Aphanomyces invadans]|nr:hypothetical protein H310_02108 [Aphanomyces invadans]ETW07641.1 hypothetical protein H310_02108 [Aphanomyces invadans]|eukprot:XP_008863734.1 hypothetical protein H310_02108 [Aphanomyces invadans]